MAIQTLPKSTKNYIRVCDCCNEKEATRVLVLSDGNGVIIDQASFCDDDWQDREIFIKSKGLDY